MIEYEIYAGIQLYRYYIIDIIGILFGDGQKSVHV